MALLPPPPADRLFLDLSLGSATLAVEAAGRDPAHPGAAETIAVLASSVRHALASRPPSGALVLDLTHEGGEVELVLPADTEAPPVLQRLLGERVEGELVKRRPKCSVSIRPIAAACWLKSKHVSGIWLEHRPSDPV